MAILGRVVQQGPVPEGTNHFINGDKPFAVIAITLYLCVVITARWQIK